MKTLIMDTATNLLIVGVINGNETTVVTRVGKNDNAAYLVNKIDEVLNKANLKLDDIDEIIVGIGPGSYTGIRVSVVVAKTLSYSKSIPLKQISSIAILTSGYEEEVVGAIDARRKYYFAGTYLKANSVIKDQYISYDEIKDETNLVILNKDTIKLNLFNIKKASRKVKDVFNLEPNYLRRTEAEVSYDKKNE